jgi:hypothetical protein
MVFNFIFSLFKNYLRCLTKFSFVKNGGGAFLLLLCLGCFSPVAVGQDICVQPACNRLSIELIKRSQNVTPGCAGGGIQCGDNFHQITYDVYLRYRTTISSPSDPLLPFSLNYKTLDVALELNTAPPYSHIDVNATDACFENGVGANWLSFAAQNTYGDGVVLTLTEKMAHISFANEDPSSPDCGANGTGSATNAIRLTYDNPPGNAATCKDPSSPGPGNPNDRCAYALLFTMVVNTFAGEAVGFDFNIRSYVPKNSALPGCPQIAIAAPPSGFNGLPSTVIANPNSFDDTPNENLRARFSGTSINPADPNAIDFGVILENIGNDPLVVNYLEFVVVASLRYLDVMPTFSGAVPRVIDGSTNLATGVTTKYLHYIIYPNTTVGAFSSIPLCTITQSPPTLGNVKWKATLSFLQTMSPTSPGTKSRISTSGDCTALRFFSNDVDYENTIGDGFCSDPSIVFKVEGTPYTCGLSKVKVGFRSTLPPSAISLSRVEFDLDFSWQGSGYTITDVHYPTWPAVGCRDFGCFTIPSSQSHQCWTTSGAGKTFQYCFDTQVNDPADFVLDDLDNMEVIITTPLNGCIENVKIRKLRMVYADGTFTACIPVIDQITGFPLCAPASEMITGKAATELGEPVAEVTLTMEGANNSNDDCPGITCTMPPCSVTDLTGNDGLYQFLCSDCSGCNLLEITPFKDDNPLNGVTTYDLVLISKHILGIEPLGSPYKMIAADANKENNITTFDIVELRKLILGIYLELPANTSWRFVEEAFVFPNPANPFQTAFPETVNCIAFPAADADLVGIKVGDVNNTAVSHSRPSERPLAALSWPVLRPAKGDVVTLPIAYTGNTEMEAVQLGLRFDPTLLRLIGPSQGDIPSYLPGNFNLLQAEQGDIRTLWLPMTGEAEMVRSNTVLFYLSFEVLADLPGAGLPLWLDNQLLDCAAWDAAGAEFALQQANASPAVAERDSPQKKEGFQVSVRPNPTVHDAVMLVQASQGETARLSICDAFGRQLVFREIQLNKGVQNISLPEFAQFPAGVYQWTLYTRNFGEQGHIVKQ